MTSVLIGLGVVPPVALTLPSHRDAALIDAFFALTRRGAAPTARIYSCSDSYAALMAAMLYKLEAGSWAAPPSKKYRAPHKAPGPARSRWRSLTGLVAARIVR